MMVDGDPYREQAVRFVLDSLTPAERVAFAAHVVGCDACARELRSLQDVLEGLAASVPIVEPDPALRRRVLVAAAAVRRPVTGVDVEEVIARRPRERSVRFVLASGWLAAAASAVMAGSLWLSSRALRQDLRALEVRAASAESALRDSRQRLEVSLSDAASSRASLALLSAPDTVDLRLFGQTPAPTARARAFLSRTRGLLVVAADLPSIPLDQVYQLWFLTPSAPVSAGLFRPEADGRATAHFDVDAATPAPVGLAVSLEPQGGVPAPTGPILLVTQ